MKKSELIICIFVLTSSFFLALGIYPYFEKNNSSAVEQKLFNPNNISTWIFSSGIFDQDLRTSNTPGFEWPEGSGKFALFTAGICASAFLNDTVKQFMCSYKGELAPGYIIDSSGKPVARTDARFKIYSVRKTDNSTVPDWLNWGQMVPYGAPYIDVNQNNVYEPLIDTPGVRNSSQTIFACLTDGFPEEHKIGEGFGGGTLPMFAELHLTAWGYDRTGLQDIQYLKWVIINKNHISWDTCYFSIVSDPDLGCATDDYIGCDSIRRLGFCYNGDNFDSCNSYSYGSNPPAVGIKYIRTAKNNSGQQIGMSSFARFHNGQPHVPCDSDPNGESIPAYNFMRGMKKDKTPFVVPPGGAASFVTKYCFSGDPESGTGWNEGPPGAQYGFVFNCGGPNVYTGPTYVMMGDKKMVISTGADNFKVNPGDTQTIVIAQLIARGTSNLNSVTKLKQLSDIAQTFYDSGYVIGVSNISSDIPQEYKLYQNYPNPFNPSTTIKFEILISPFEGGKGDVKLVIYDITGKAVETLIDKELKAGSYSADWNAVNYATGVYFYSLLIDGNIIDTKKMLILK